MQCRVQSKLRVFSSLFSVYFSVLSVLLSKSTKLRVFSAVKLSTKNNISPAGRRCRSERTEGRRGPDLVQLLYMEKIKSAWKMLK